MKLINKRDIKLIMDKLSNLENFFYVMIILLIQLAIDYVENQV